MKGTNAKDWAIDEINEIKQLCEDLRYICNKELKIKAINQIEYLASRILEHLEYLDIKEDNQC